MFHKILCPVDLGEFTSVQLALACGFAKTQDARVSLLHVVSMPVGLYDMDTLAALQKEWNAQARDRLKSVCENGKTEGLITHGLIVDEILATAESGGYDLIFMPTHGRRGLQRFFLGSTFHGVLTRSPLPVMVLPPLLLEQRPDHFAKPSRILCAVDLQHGSAHLVSVTEKLAAEFQSSFDVLHCIHVQRDVFPMLAPESLAHTARRIRDRMLSQHPEIRSAREIQVENGAAYEQIVQCAEKNRIDLVVLGFSRTSPWRIRTTLYRAISALRVPALCIPLGTQEEAP